MEIARSIASSFVDFLIERVASFAQRASRPTASTPASAPKTDLSCVSEPIAGTTLAEANFTP
jgi:hypothetical protein